jgi:hypothetical protein
MPPERADLIDRLGELGSVALVDRWTAFFVHWTLLRQMSTHGVQGVILVCESKDSSPRIPLLIKLHRRPHDELRHEALVNDDIKRWVEPSSPQFMTVDYHCYMPWSWKLEDQGRPSLPRYALFFRPAPSRLTMSTLGRRFWYDTPLIMSQMCLMLAGLQLAQQLARFTSYDAHMANVLIQRTDARWFLYRFSGRGGEDGRVVMLPTYGHYPFFIDYGRAHSVSVPTQPSIGYCLQHQDKGIQSAVFDGAYDVHHLLLWMAHALESSMGEDESGSESDESGDEGEDSGSGDEGEDSGSGDEGEGENSGSEGQAESGDEGEGESEALSGADSQQTNPSTAESEIKELSDDESVFSDLCDPEPIPYYRPHCSEEMLDLTIRLFAALPINSSSGRRLYEHDVCERLFQILDSRLPAAEAESYWLWEEFAPVLFDQLGPLMKPLTTWGSQEHPLPKRRLSDEGLDGVVSSNPMHHSFRVMMTLICKLLPKVEDGDQDSSEDEVQEDGDQDSSEDEVQEDGDQDSSEDEVQEDGDQDGDQEGDQDERGEDGDHNELQEESDQDSGDNERSVEDSTLQPLITHRRSWYSAVFRQWVLTCVELHGLPDTTAASLFTSFQSKVVGVGLDQAPDPTCVLDWDVKGLDWMAAAHHTVRFGECVQRLADVLLRVNVECVEAGWLANPAGRVQPIDVIQAFVPMWIYRDDCPDPGDRVLVCDGVENTSYELTLKMAHLPTTTPGAWLDWGPAVFKKITQLEVTSSTPSSCPPP